MHSSISGLLAWGGGAAIGFQMIQIGNFLSYSQLVDPLLPGILWPICVAGVILITILVGLVAGGAWVVFLQSIGSPRLLGRASYTLMGGGGVVGSIGGATYRGYQLIQTDPLGTQTNALLALLLVAVPVLYMTNKIRIASGESNQREQVESELSPEEIYAKRRSNNEPTNIRQNKMYPSKSTRNQETTELRQTELPTRSQEINDEDLEFNWTINTGIDFSDVGGMDDLKRIAQREIIKPLTTHKRQAETLGISVPNVLFYGPPGTGKTYFAHALATEIGFPIAEASGSDLKSKWINESASRVQELFLEGERIAEEVGGAIVFLDEVDALIPKREELGTYEEDRKVTNEFLNAIEKTKQEDILLIGATNRIEALDEAAIRNGRIDKKIHVGFPDQDVRQEILTTQLSQRPHNVHTAEIDRIAKNTEGWTAADIESLIESAARRALINRNDDQITSEDLFTALQEMFDTTSEANQSGKYPGIF